MSDLVTRLRGWRNWREVHIVRTHMLLEEAADYVELLEAASAHSHSGFMVMASAVDGMSGEIARLRQLSQYGDCPVADNAANADNTPAAHAAPSEGSVQNGCTLTDVERAAIERAVKDENDFGLVYTADVLQSLLERTR